MSKPYIVVIAGGRKQRLSEPDREALWAELLSSDTGRAYYGYGLVLRHGACSGVDADAAEWGEVMTRHRTITVEPHPARWEKHGKAAGPIRNRQMMEGADLCILFPGGRGTADCAKAAWAAGVEVLDWR